MIQMVEMLAQECIKRGKVRCPPVPTELALLVDKQHTIETHLLSLRSYHGAIWYLRGKWIVQLKKDDTRATQRFTLFHEAFHILAHCKTTPVFKKRGTEEGSFNELLADGFANFVMMPRKWVKEKWAEVRDPNQMAGILGVTKPAMCIRLKRLSLI